MKLARCLAGLVGVSVVAAFGCSKDDDDKDPRRTGGVGGTVGGEAGPTGGTGGAGAMGGGAGMSGSGGMAGGGAGGMAGGGSGGMAGSGGGAGASGAAGASGSAGADAGTDASDGGTGCPAGTGECDGNPATVCEADLTLITSCGSCTTSCNGANGLVECQSGVCTITSCNSGFGDCDNDPSTGCEESLNSNASHCGSCGRDCASAGSTCSVDRCDPITLHTGLPIASGNSDGLTWAYGNNAFYNVGYVSYTLRRIPDDGSPASTVWSSTSPAGRQSLIVNSTEVIWTQRGTPSVVLMKPHTAAAADNPTVVFTPQYQPYFLQVRGNAYYWLSGDYQSSDPAGYVYTRSTSAPMSDPGAQIVSVDQGTHGAVLQFVTSTDALYWYTTDGNADEIRTTPLSGGTPTVVPTGQIEDGFSAVNVKLRTDGTTLFYNQEVGTSFANGIYRWDPGDASGTQLVVAEGVVDFVVDADFIYYITNSASRVFKAPRSGAAGVEIANVSSNKILYQDADSIYVARVNPTNTDIHRVLK